MTPDPPNSLRGRKVVSWIGVGLGILAFFLPLVSIRAPIVGDLQWSSYNIVSNMLGSESKGDTPSFSQIVSSQESKHPPAGTSVPEPDIPFGIRAAIFFPVAVLSAYVALIFTVLQLLFSYVPRTVAFTSFLGSLAAIYSLISVFLLDDAIRTQMSASMKGMESNPFAGIGAALAASIRVQPGAGVYLLVGCFVFLLLVQYIVALDRLTLETQQARSSSAGSSR